jgi:transposase-like protein
MKFDREKIKSLIESNGFEDVGDVQEAMKELFGDIIKEMLEGELEEELGYSKHDYKNKETDNSRNGHSKKTVRSDYGEIELEIPRDRKGEFEPVVVKKHQRDISGIEDQVISMYARGMTVRDIQSHIENIYGSKLSSESISRITDKILPLVSEWRNRPLESAYAIVYMDAVFFRVVESNQVRKKALYIALGVSLNGYKDILGMWISETEGASYWLSILNELKNRGVEDVAIFSVDALSGMEEAIEAVYPFSEVQKCIVHQIRNTMRYVTWRDRKPLARDLKTVYQAPTREAGWNALLALEEKWGNKYLLSIKSWKDNWETLSTFFQYPEELRRLVYTTNPIESVNRQLRKVTKNKGVFPTDTSLLKMAYLAIINITKKWTVRTPDWPRILTQLVIKYERLAKYIS